MVDISTTLDQLGKLNRINQYTLTINNLIYSISVLSVTGKETLNQPWRYDIIFTCPDKQIPISSILSQSASLTFHEQGIAKQLIKISSLQKTTQSRTLYGIITQFSLLSVSNDEARYQVVLGPRLSLFANDHYSAIYQNQSVVSVVEEVLKRHSFTGIDYRFELKNSYPVREFISQWQESDLEFIQRLLSDVGIWFRFESHSEHHCDVLVLSDYEQGFENAGHIIFKTPSGMVDGKQNCVWNLKFSCSVQPQQVITQDYNYCTAKADQYSLVNSQPKDKNTRGIDYRYGEHYRNKGDDQTIESGHWYAKIRHEAHLSNKIIISGECNDYNLVPGQHIIIDGSTLVLGDNDITEGIIILSTQSYGDRSEHYHTNFTAIPYDALKSYRPMPLPWPTVNGTLPARVTSPDNDTYGYIDIHGRYRVKFVFDIKTWKNGEESLWVRLAKPYAGDTYGFHFPLIDGTEVAIAFSGGNPDRPYIAYAMHDSTHPDHVATANKHRNVIRTPANNKLRMDDKRGQEHIKLATEYGKTQLNIGHLVNSNKELRGEGFELRTDEWGSIAAEKGLYLTTSTSSKATGQQLDMQGAIAQLENALNLAKGLQNIAQKSQALSADIASQEQLKSALIQLEKNGMIAYAQEGIGLTSPKNIQLSSSSNISITAEKNTDINVLKKMTLAAGEAISLFAHKAGMKLFASKGKVEIQAQTDTMELAAKQDISINSVAGKAVITAAEEILLACGGSYIKITDTNIELGTLGDVFIKSASLQKMDGEMIPSPVINLPNADSYSEFFILKNHDTGKIMPFHPYEIDINGKLFTGITDEQGRTQRLFTDKSQILSGVALEKEQGESFDARHKQTGKIVKLKFSECNKDE